MGIAAPIMDPSDLMLAYGTLRAGVPLREVATLGVVAATLGVVTGAARSMALAALEAVASLR